MELLIRLIIMLVKSLAGDDKPQVRRVIGTGPPPVPGDYYPPPRTATPTRSQNQQTSEEERLRKFMEALGVPAGSVPPRRIVRPQQLAPAGRQAPKQIVRNVSTPPPISSTPPPMPPLYQAETFGTPPARSDYDTAAPVISATAPVAAQPAVDFKALLRSPSSIRTAIVLKEILGAPRGLQPFEGAYNQR